MCFFSMLELSWLKLGVVAALLGVAEHEMQIGQLCFVAPSTAKVY